VVIKCAASATDSVGVTFKMLERLDSIIGAFQLDDGSFELWSLSPEKFRQEMRDTRSRGSAAGKVGIVRRDFFERVEGCSPESSWMQPSNYNAVREPDSLLAKGGIIFQSRSCSPFLGITESFVDLVAHDLGWQRLP